MEGVTITLQGVKEPNYLKETGIHSFKREVGDQTVSNTGVVFCITNEKGKNQIKTKGANGMRNTTVVTNLLEQYEDGFFELFELPPERELENQIVLKPGSELT